MNLRSPRQPKLGGQYSQPQAPQQPSFSAQPQTTQQTRYYGEGDMNQWQPASPQPYMPEQQTIQATNPDFSGSAGFGQMGMYGQQPTPQVAAQPTPQVAQGLQPEPTAQIMPTGEVDIFSQPQAPLSNEQGLQQDLRQEYLSQLFGEFNSKRQQQSPIPNGEFEKDKRQFDLGRFQQGRGMGRRNGWGGSVPSYMQGMDAGFMQQRPMDGQFTNSTPVQMPTPNIDGVGSVPPVQMPRMGGFGGMGGLRGAKGRFGGMGMFGQQPTAQIMPVGQPQPVTGMETGTLPVGAAPAEYTDMKTKYEQMLQQLKALQGGQQSMGQGQRMF